MLYQNPAQLVESSKRILVEVPEVPTVVVVNPYTLGAPRRGICVNIDILALHTLYVRYCPLHYGKWNSTTVLHGVYIYISLIV